MSKKGANQMHAATGHLEMQKEKETGIKRVVCKTLTVLGDIHF